MIRVGILTVSDKVFHEGREDHGGPAVRKRASRRGWPTSVTAVVPDDARRIASVLRRWCSSKKAPDVIFTTGGTGLGPRDVTPEATRAVLDKEAPGLAERIRRLGEEHNPHSILSRGVCGSHLRTLVVNLPESADGAAESFEAVADVLPHAVLMLRGSSHPARHERA